MKFNKIYKLVLEDLEDENINSLSIDKQKSKLAQDGTLIKYISNPSEELQLIAVNNTTEAILFIKNPTKTVENRVQELEIEKENYLDDLKKEELKRQEQEYYEQLEQEKRETEERDSLRRWKERFEQIQSGKNDY